MRGVASSDMSGGSWWHGGGWKGEEALSPARARERTWRTSGPCDATQQLAGDEGNPRLLGIGDTARRGRGSDALLTMLSRAYGGSGHEWQHRAVPR